MIAPLCCISKDLESTTIQKAKNYQLDKVWHHSSLVLTALNWFLICSSGVMLQAEWEAPCLFLLPLMSTSCSPAFLLPVQLKIEWYFSILVLSFSFIKCDILAHELKIWWMQNQSGTIIYNLLEVVYRWTCSACWWKL